MIALRLNGRLVAVPLGILLVGLIAGGAVLATAGGDRGRTPSVVVATVHSRTAMEDGPADCAEIVAAQRAAPASAGVYFGVWQPGVPEDMSQLTAFEQSVGKRAAIVMIWRDWADDKGWLDTDWLCAIAAHGSIPLISWSPADWRTGADQSPYSLDNIIAGNQDGYIESWAQQLAAYGGPVLLRFAHEMNGSWYPWAQQGANTPAKYVAAWRHVHDLFVQAGATNVQWVWSPNAMDDGNAATAFEPYYPGDQYVDWVGLDGYNFASSGWLWFKQIFDQSYTRITALTSKPLMIAEMGSADELPNQAANGDTKARWLADAFGTEIPDDYPLIRAVVWFNEDESGDTPHTRNFAVQSSDSALQAFRQAIASPLYLSSWP
ncbi:MAG TPA: glycosyl hydrolase [Dehalococcoidia bacterium]|nr:glycosyl hydrolase [Dehalococcoidia bacterium]